MKKLFFISLTLLILFSCSKYEDGPLISFRSKEERIVNSWMYKLVLRNGNNITLINEDVNYAASSIGFNDKDRFTQIDVVNEIFVSKDGNWSFASDKDSLALKYDDGTSRRLLITRLKEKELFLEEKIGDNLYEYELLPNK